VGVKRSIEFTSATGDLKLYAEVQGPEDAPLSVLCLHGLTRNSADFEFLSAHLSSRYRVIAADQRGRGKSAWDPDPARYHPGTYVADMFVLLDRLKIERAVLIGTSMGGLMSMIMGATRPARIQGMVLNDIGPVVPAAGLQRLRNSLNEKAVPATWTEAVQQAKRMNAIAFPDYGEAEWEAFARRLYVEDQSGRPIRAFDLGILKGLEVGASAVPPDMWALWAQLKSIPMLAIRGALSDILSADTLVSMAARHPLLEAVTIPNRGHAPMLDEPVAVAAIGAYLSRLA
jgi:pimeloyl-ACP methyl ester carboxylesterase